MSEHVRVEREPGVLAIALARPERRNAITVAMYAALADAIEDASKDPGIRVVTIRGEGQDFAAGNDLVIADETARFSMPFVDLALVPEAASSLLFPRIAGRRRSARYLLLCESFGAEEAEAIGLVSHRVAAGMLDEKLGQLVGMLLAKPPEALRQTQHLLRHAAREEILERMRLESSRFAERLASAEVKEAISAFFEKRKPNFAVNS